jgi:outer membrane protein OmpA-like peptidoglycan-associated protein
MKFTKACILFALHFQCVTAQNLVPDSSFENNKLVPMDFSAVNASYAWSIPSWGTSDLFCKCDRQTKINRNKLYSEVDVPQNSMGNQAAHSGNCYAGIFMFSHGNYREYLQTALTTPLQKNKTYRFTLYISLADYSCASVDQLGVCFSDHKSDYHSSEVITDLAPVYMNIEREVGNDTKSWHRISATYKAQGGESYLLFGSFDIHKLRKTKIEAPKEIRTRINQTAGRDAYYYLDDVSLVEIETEEPADAPAKGTIAKTTTDSLFVLKNIVFETNETTLLPSSFLELDALVCYLNKNIQNTIDISGHTDNSGNENTNKKLSKGRAKEVADYLISKGIDKKRISYAGYGSSKPISTNDTEEGKQQNRRVEFVLKKK